ncbi:ABC transporter substrate-binding protein [Methanoregula formicica]|uniref:ABC transporter substrate-binding protein n=1 Tax=Methanoregula formicica TaxID=882104 RepID=UPI00130E1866|nr:ABC transporter substrate-binding protein [Methanoregula formicica]
MQPTSPSPSVEPVAVGVSSQITGACTPVTITQTDGTEITLPCHPERIIVTNSNAAEMMIAIGAGDKILGVTQSTTNVSYIMEKIPQAENIGDWQIPNVEKILALHPDVVIAYASSKPKNTDQLAAANITLVYLDCFRLPTLAHDARALGTLTGHKNEAEVYARLVEDTVADVTAKVKTIPENSYPAVYSESYTDYMAAGPGSGSDELLSLAGGKNIAEDVAASSMKISTEWVVARQPTYIFKVISSGNSKPFPEIHAALVNRTGWDTIPAVKNDRVYLFANDVQYGPRAYIGLVYTAQLLHPDDFRELHPRAMLDEYALRYVSGTNRTGMVYP